MQRREDQQGGTDCKNKNEIIRLGGDEARGKEKMKIISQSCGYIHNRGLQCHASRASPRVGGLMSGD